MEFFEDDFAEEATEIDNAQIKEENDKTDAEPNPMEVDEVVKIEKLSPENSATNLPIDESICAPEVPKSEIQESDVEMNEIAESNADTENIVEAPVDSRLIQNAVLEREDTEQNEEEQSKPMIRVKSFMDLCSTQGTREMTALIHS